MYVTDLISSRELVFSMARNFGHARAVNIQTWENLKQYGYTKLYKTLIGVSQQYGLTSTLLEMPKCSI